MTKEKIILAYKGFDKNFKCRNFQYEIGKEYTHDGNTQICKSGFRSCERPLDVLGYYPPNNSVFAIVEATGDISKENPATDSKISSSMIKIKTQITIADLVKSTIDFNWTHSKKTGRKTTKIKSGAASATGDNGAASATGGRGAASATGEMGAASATGGSGAASATGWRGAASATGWSGAASATGARGAASATGWRGAASATGGSGAASATGEMGAASATGWRGSASATGGSGAASITTGESGAAEAVELAEQSVACGVGIKNRARASVSNWIVLAERDGDGNILEIKTAKAGRDIKPDIWYELIAGVFKEVD